MFFAAKDREALYSQQKKTLSCGSDHQLLIAKFRLKLNKVGKITWPFRCGLNQIPYDYRVEVINRFWGLDLVDRVPEELMRVQNIVQEVVTKTIPKKKKVMLSDEALQINEKRKEVKGKGERERYTNMQKKGKECNRMGKTRDLFWRMQWHPTPVLLLGKSHGRRSLMGCRLWGRTESDTTEVT